MDPTTIISMIGVAYSVAKGVVVVGTALYKFKSDVHDFDHKSEAFVDEIKALGAACQMASQRLETILKDYESTAGENCSFIGHSEQLWSCLENQIIACQNTIQGLRKVYGDTVRSDGGSTTWKRVVKQLTLYLKVFDITEARERIKSHTTSLQIVLLSVNIELSYLVPRHIDQKLQVQLTDLANMKDELSKLLSQRAMDSGDNDRNKLAILAASGAVITSGETLYSGSTADESTFGGYDLVKRRTVDDWVHSFGDNQVTNRIGPEYDSGSGSHDLADSCTDINNPLYCWPDKGERAGQPSEEESDDDESFDYEVEFAIHCIDDGRTAFERRDYTAANAMLQEAWKVVMELPRGRQKVCDLEEVRYMLAFCAFHLHDAASAKTALLTALGTGLSCVPHVQRRISEISHMLSQVYVRLGGLEQARLSCKSAMKGRQKLLGKSHELVYESFALMGRILELQGNTTRAGFFRTMIPQTHEQLITQFKELKIGAVGQQCSPPDEIATLPSADVDADQVRIEATLGLGIPALPRTPSVTSNEVDVWSLLSRKYKFRIPNLQDWADAKGYGELGSLSWKQRQEHLKRYELIPESRIEKALAGADDEEALRLSKARSRLKPVFGAMRFSLVRELRLAVLFAVTSVVQVLVEKGVSLDAADSAGWTMLHYAALSGSVATAELLIKKGASVSAAEQKGNISPLSIALKHDYLDICDLLWHHKANPLWEFHWQIGTPVHIACAKNILPLVRAWSHGSPERITSAVHIVAPGLLNRDYRKLEADFSKSSVIEPRIVKRMTITPIGVAALMGSTDVMKWAISTGMMGYELCRLGDREYGESQPVSAMALAAAAGQTLMVQILRDMENNTVQMDNGTEALKMAVLNKMEDTACWLLGAGIRADEQIIFWAERYGLKKIAGISTFDRKPCSF